MVSLPFCPRAGEAHKLGLVRAAVVLDDEDDLLHVLHVVGEAGNHLVVGVDQVAVQRQVAPPVGVVVERDERHRAEAAPRPCRSSCPTSGYSK